MFRCPECHKIFFGNNNKDGICQNCIDNYINQAKNIIANEIEPDILSSKNKNISLIDRHTKIISAKNKFEKMLTEKSGIMADMYMHQQILDLKHNIEVSKSSIENLISIKSENTSNCLNNDGLQFQGDTVVISTVNTVTATQSHRETTSHYSASKGKYTKVQKRVPPYTHLTIKKSYSKVQNFPNDYIVFDLETTGFSPATDRIIEIGAIKYIGGVEKERFHSYINPECTIPRAASNVNHIYDTTVQNAPTIGNIFCDFLDFIDNYTLIAHNSDFDMSFIQTNSYYITNKTIQNDVIDTLSLAREYLYELPNKKLETIKRHFNITVNSHNAIDDCIVTAYLYQFCQDKELSHYKYGVYSYSEDIELNDKEVEYLNKIIEICELNKINKSKLNIQKTSGLVHIFTKDLSVSIKFKLCGRLQYILLNIPTETFETMCTTKLKYTESSASEGNTTRLFIQNPEQLYKFTKYLLKTY